MEPLILLPQAGLHVLRVRYVRKITENLVTCIRSALSLVCHLKHSTYFNLQTKLRPLYLS